MAGVILRTAGGTLLFIAFLWLVRVDDYRVAGMMLTFPMLNGIGLVGAGGNAERLTKSMVPVITLNGLMAFLFTLALVLWEGARLHPGLLIAAAVAVWIGIYAALEAGEVTFARNSSMFAFVGACAAASIALTYWLWPSCPSGTEATVVRAGGVAGVLEGWPTILLFALSLLILFGFAHRFQHAHAAIGRLAALPMVPLFGLYAAATAAGPGPDAIGKLETMRSMVLVGWIFAVVFAVTLSRYVMRSARAHTGTATRMAVLVAGWAVCLGCILASARIAVAVAGCELR